MAKRKPQKKKPGLTVNQQRYNDLMKKVNRKIRRAQARGFMIADAALLQRPQKIQKSRLQKLEALLKGDAIYDILSYVDETTGEVVSGAEGKKIERRRAAAKAAETRKRKKEPPAPADDIRSILDDLDDDDLPDDQEMFLDALADLVKNWDPENNWDHPWSRRMWQLKGDQRNRFLAAVLAALQAEDAKAIDKRLQYEGWERLRADAKYILYYGNLEAAEAALSDFIEKLGGHPLDSQESAALNEIASEEEDFYG